MGAAALTGQFRAGSNTKVLFDLKNRIGQLSTRSSDLANAETQTKVTRGEAWYPNSSKNKAAGYGRAM